MLISHFLDEDFKPEYLKIPVSVNSEDYYYDKFHTDLLELINKYQSVDLKHLGFIEKWESIL